jgi:serine/threonine protein kinase/Tol biopolymer transport system component
MGEVYRARDTRLGRDVAIKVLPQHLSSNPEVRARFEREAKTVSSLNHPNICTLFDVGRDGDIDYLVMEMIEGETLAARLAKGALPLADTLRTGSEIADALDRAHRAGVVHRDLKPGNVMLTKSGAKLMDFGLARAVGLAGTSGLSTGVTVGVLTQSPTVAQPLTAEGTIIGTFQYMAPEQLEGKETDARSDLWAFGCVLYEMATGRRAFDGKSQASLITSIMGSQPAPISQVSPMSPPALERLVSAMIAKDPADRVQSAHDVKLQLQWMGDGGSTAGGSTASPVRLQRRNRWMPWGVAAVAILAAVFLAWRGARQGVSSDPPVHAAITPPPGVLFSSSTDSPLPIAISPDGNTIAFCARTGEGPDMLWVRSVDKDDARTIAGTQGAQGPFFAPDGKSIGFFTRGHLKTVNTAGGAVIELVKRVDARGGTWNADGTIVYGDGTNHPLMTVGQQGGQPHAVSVLDSTRGETTHRYPYFLPDGKHFLYLARRSGAGAGRQPTIFVGELGSNERKLVLEVASNVQYASGFLLYVREAVLVAQRFNPKTFLVSGPALPLIDDARMDERFSRAVFSVSQNGVLVCMTGKNQTRTQLAWLDRKGTLLKTVGDPADYTYGGTPELSPDDAQSVMPVANRERGVSDVWIVDLNSGRRRRLTVDQDDHPAAVWSTRGRVVVATSKTSSTTAGISVLSPEGVVERRIDLSTDFTWPRSVSPDGSIILTDASASTAGAADVTAMSTLGDTTRTLLAGGDGVQTSAQFSPDGRFFAFQSDESGRFEIYVALYPTGARWQVSQEGGIEPRWRSDGKELFFVDRENYINAVGVTLRPGSFEAESSTKLFQLHGNGGGWRYDVSRDGSRFLVAQPLSEDLALPVTIITDWTRKVVSK